MQRILTAMGNCELNDKLKKCKYFSVYDIDIQYREGIIEILKENSNFDVLIIYEKLSGEIDINNLIKKIRDINPDINIIYILDEKNTEFEKLLYEKNIKSIFYNNEINLDEFINIIKKLNLSKEIILKNEIINLKKEIQIKNEELSNKKNSRKIVFIIDNNLDEIKKYKNIINIIKNNYLINSEKINIVFLETKKSINFKILKNFFRGYRILGKIKIKNNKYIISKKIKELDKWN